VRGVLVGLRRGMFREGVCLEGTEGENMTRNLQVEDVKELITQARSIDADPIAIVTRLFQGLGESATVTGEVLEESLVQSKIPVPREVAEILDCVEAVSKEGDQIKVQLESQMQPVMRGTPLRLGPVIAFTVQNFPDGMAMADISGVSVNKFVWIDVQRAQFHESGGRRTVRVDTNFGGREFVLP